MPTGYCKIHGAGFCNWFESAKIVSDIAFNAQQGRFYATLSQLTKPRHILLVGTSYEICMTAMNLRPPPSAGASTMKKRLLLEALIFWS